MHPSNPPSLLRKIVLGALFVLGLATFQIAEAEAQCTVCDTCASDAECGPAESCLDLGEGIGRCTTFCDTTVCPGDSRCYGVDSGGETFYLCLNQGAPADGICGGNWSCSDQRTCPSAGLSCADGGAACGSDAEVCPADGNGVEFCSCFCNTDADCGVGDECFQVDTRGVCVPGQQDLCAEVQCAADQICSPATGTCIGGAGDTSMGTDTAAADADTGPADATTTATGPTTSATGTAGTDATSGSDLLLPGTDTAGPNNDASGDCSCRIGARESESSPILPVLGALLGLGLVAARRRH